MENVKSYSISEVSKITDYPTHVLRYYESDFDLEIPRTNSNRRYYTDKEIETFIYIKDLQGKGLTNKQIKLILKSPEIMINNTETQVAATSEMSIVTNECTDIVSMNEIQEFQSLVAQDLKYKMDEVKMDIITYIDNMLEKNTSSMNKELEQNVEDNMETNEIEEGSNSQSSKNKDLLISENARLKMKVKEKNYELAELRNRVKKLEDKKGFWSKVFGG